MTGRPLYFDVGDEALEEFLKIKPGDGATIRVVEEGGKRVAKASGFVRKTRTRPKPMPC